MRARTSIKNILNGKTAEGEVRVCGWVKSLRNSKSVSFMVVNDGSSFQNLQIVLEPNLDNYDKLSKLLMGSSVEVFGKVVSSQGNQKFELLAQKVNIIGTVPEDYPLQKKATSLEFLREIAYLRPRTNTFNAVFRLRHVLAMATHDFFNKKDFYYIHTPIITSSDCEGAGELFQVSTLPLNQPPKNIQGQVDFSKDYFGLPTYLAVSGQLQGEAFALGMGSIYTFGPTFRSENSHTSRHLAEFWMIEPEVAFADLDEVADLASQYIKHMIKAALEQCPDELAFFNQHYKNDLISTLQNVLNNPFQKITYTDAVALLQKSGKKFDFKVQWGVDLQTEHERYLTDEHFKGPVIVTDYPKEIKSFYMKLNEDGKTVRAMDVLVPGVGEIIGGSQREDNHDLLLERMNQKGLKEQDYFWYLNLRKFGSAPHAGFGLGFERAVMYISGMSNIRDVIAFPRFPGNAQF